jgi:hypothetical protein
LEEAWGRPIADHDDARENAGSREHVGSRESEDSQENADSKENAGPREKLAKPVRRVHREKSEHLVQSGRQDQR